MKFDLIEPADWEETPQAARGESAPPLPSGPVGAAAEQVRARLREQTGALQATLDRMWEAISSARDGETAVEPADAVVPEGFRPGAFSARDT